MDIEERTVVSELNRQFLESHPATAAAELEALSPAGAAEILAAVPPAAGGPALASLSADIAAEITAIMAPDAAAALVEDMVPLRQAAILGQMSEEARGRLCAAVDERIANEWRAMLGHPADSAGRVMDTRFISFVEGLTAGQAFARIKRFPKRAGASYFITDRDSVLRARVSLKALALAEADVLIDELSEPIVAIARVEDSRAAVAAAMQNVRVFEMPVVDTEGRLIGVIRYDALVDAIRDTATVDIQTMFGASKDERALSPAAFAVRKRLPWLEINLLTAFLAAAVVGAFESTIAQFTALAVLLPVVAGQSGNAGAQALAVTIRGLALREVSIKAWIGLASKEIKVGFVNGMAIAITTGVGVYIWSGSMGLAAVIFLSMIISMLIAGVAGAMVPVMLARIGQDPAQSSSIVLTTITDVAGFMSFLGIATLLAAYLPTG